MVEGDSSPGGNESLALLPSAAAVPRSGGTQCHGGTPGSPTGVGLWGL